MFNIHFNDIYVLFLLYTVVEDMLKKKHFDVVAMMSLFDFGCSSGELIYNFLSSYGGKRAVGVECVYDRFLKAVNLLRGFGEKAAVYNCKFGDPLTPDDAVWITELCNANLVWCCDTVMFSTHVSAVVSLFLSYCKVGSFLALFSRHDSNSLVMVHSIPLTGRRVGSWGGGNGKCDKYLFIHEKI